MNLSCNSTVSSNAEQASLCPRNVYSRNGVVAVCRYSYSTKEGIIDTSSKILDTIEKYDSLGNVIYYKGPHYPKIDGVDFFDYHYEIRDELDLSWDATYTYKMEYNDTVFTKASLFDDEGKYIARIEQCVEGNRVADSIYIRNSVIYVRHTFRDKEGRDSLKISYDNEGYQELSFAEEEKHIYRMVGNVLIDDRIIKSRDLFFNINHKYTTSKGHGELTYDADGRLVKQVYGKLRTELKYDERGFVTESILSDEYNNSKTLTKSEYYDNGLLKNSYRYADMTICESYIVYEYTYR